MLFLLPQEPPKIMSRAEWHAAPMILHPVRHTVRFLTIHHTGVAQKPSMEFGLKLRNLQKWCQREDRTSFDHVKPAWPDIPYHYYIDWSGKIAEGRPSGYVGDTNTTYDPTGHLLIVVEGDFTKEKPSAAQLASMEALTVFLAKKYRIPRTRIGAHGDYARTDCPGPALLPEVRKLKTAF